MRSSRLVLWVLDSADWNVVMRLRGRLWMKLIALVSIVGLEVRFLSWCMAGLSAVNNRLVVQILVCASVPNRADPFVPAQLIMVMIGIVLCPCVWCVRLCRILIPVSWLLSIPTWRVISCWLTLSRALLGLCRLTVLLCRCLRRA